MVPFEIPMKSRLVILPDVHRDLAKAKTILRRCNIIDTNNRWMCYDTIVVQMGDQVDGANRTAPLFAPGPNHEHGRSTAEDVEVLKFFDGLATQAPARNSLCISMLGNHEVMNVAGMHHYADLADCKICSRAREAIFRPGSELCRNLSESRKCVLKVGPFLLSHAGVAPHHLARVNGDLGMYNSYARALLRGEGRKFQILESLIGSEGFLSHRAFQPMNVTPETMAGVAKVLESTKAKHMVTAHNTTPGQVPVFGNKNQLIVFDPGMSRAVADQKPTALDIREGQINIVQADD